MYGIVLLLVLLFVITISYQVTRDFFSPLCFFSVLQILRYVPYLCGENYEELTFQTLTYQNTFPTFLFELLALFSVAFGYLLANSFIKIRHKTFSSHISVPEYNQKSILFLFVLGMIGRIAIIKFAGGFSVIVGNNAAAYSKLDTGTGYLYLLSDFSIVACMMQLSNVVFCIKNKIKRKTAKSIILLITMSVLYIFTFIIFTSRSPILELILYMVFGVNYLFRRFRAKDLFNVKTIFIVVFALAIIVVLPMIRVSNYDDSANTKSLMWRFFDQFTIVGRDTFVYNHFGKNQTYWYGRSYLGLFTSFIPSAVFPSKPPVDDGIYLSNLIYGYKVLPPVSDSYLNVKYSIPFSTSGLAYANFGVFGIIFANIILGIAFSFGYKYVKTNKTPFAVLIYAFLLYQLELTTLSIVQTMMPILICVISYLLFGRNSNENFLAKRQFRCI